MTGVASLDIDKATRYEVFSPHKNQITSDDPNYWHGGSNYPPRSWENKLTLQDTESVVEEVKQEEKLDLKDPSVTEDTSIMDTTYNPPVKIVEYDKTFSEKS